MCRAKGAKGAKGKERVSRTEDTVCMHRHEYTTVRIDAKKGWATVLCETSHVQIIGV